MKAQTIDPQLHMNASCQSQKLCFEYEHFMFHQRATTDRIAFSLRGFFTEDSKQDNILNVCKYVQRHHSSRPDDPKRIYALAIETVINKHRSFLAPIHSSEVGRGKTERDRLSHKWHIPFVNPYVAMTPPGKAFVVFQATLNGRSIEPEDARTILHHRYDQTVEFTKDMLNAFFDAN